MILLKNTALTLISAILALISSIVGVFYSFGGMTRTVENIYGETITLFGDGIYQNDAIFKVAIIKGTDIAIIFIALTLITTVVFLKNKRYASFLQVGLLSIILYATTGLIMGTVFNRLFLLYTIQFSFAFFAFIFTFKDLIYKNSFSKSCYKRKWKGTAIFLIIAGCSVLQWLAFIIPSILFGTPVSIIDIYTTEPTFIIDLAIILPTVLYCGIMLLKQKTFAYQLTPILLILLTGVALCVICQTIMQSILGITISLSELIGLGVVFIVLGIVAVYLNIRLLRHLK